MLHDNSLIKRRVSVGEWLTIVRRMSYVTPKKVIVTTGPTVIGKYQPLKRNGM